MLVIRPGRSLDVRAVTDCRLLLLDGATLDGPRHIWWNFVASSQERIEQAKQDGPLASSPKSPGKPNSSPSHPYNVRTPHKPFKGSPHFALTIPPRQGVVPDRPTHPGPLTSIHLRTR